MRFFLDTNVLFDLFQDERPSFSDSNKLVKLGLMGKLELVVTGTSIMSMIYSLQRYKFPKDQIVGRQNLLLPHLTIAQVGSAELLAGLNSGWKDLEDAIQYHAAISTGRIDAIVSNDKDFKQQKLVPVLTPKQALKRVK